MDLLGDLEEALFTTDDLPVGDESQVVQDGNSRPQQLRHPTAVGCRIDMEDAGALKRCCLTHQIVEHRVRRDASIRAQRTGPDVDELKQVVSSKVRSQINSGEWLAELIRATSGGQFGERL